MTQVLTDSMVVPLTEEQERLIQKDGLIFLSNAIGKPLAIDTETNHWEKGAPERDVRDGTGYATGVSLAYVHEGRIVSHYFPFRHKVGFNYEKSTLVALKEVIEKCQMAVFHNAKFDIVSLRTLGINYTGKWYCTMIMCHLINENFPRAKSLDACSAYYMKGQLDNQKKKSEEQKKIEESMGWDYVPTWMMRKYAEQDTALTLRLFNSIWNKFCAEDLVQYWPYKARLVEVVIAMESRGIGVDVPLCKKMIDEAEHRMFDYMDMIGGFNPGSNKDMTELFINRLKLPVVKWTLNKDGSPNKPSFDKDAMAIYDQMLENSDDPLAEYVLAYRGWSKSKASFYQAYLTHLSPDGRLRPSYRHHKDSEEGGTLTGRLSCAEPNLQQIPRVSDKAWNGEIKKALIPSDGYRLWEVDYSQLELRLGTAYGRVDTLRDVFNEDRDIFTEMSGPLDLTRQQTKTFVYSTQYGAGVNRIKTVFGITETRAREIRQNYFNAYPGFKRIADETAAKAKASRAVKLWSGRSRHFVNPAEEAHKALNSVIQGGAADIVERVMIRLFDEIDQPSSGEVRMLLQVHDSVVFEIKEGREDYWLPKITALMEDVQPKFYGVKFAVEAKEWGS